MRVLHCIYDDPENPWVGGGASVRAFEIYRRLVDELDATVVSGNYPGARDETIDGVAYRRLGAARPYAWSRWSYARTATALLARADYDVAVFDFSVYTPIRLPRNRSVGLAVHHLSGPTARQRWGRLVGALITAVERRMLSGARWVSTPSAWTCKRLRRILSAGTQVQVVGNGVADELFGVERREQKYLLYFGRLDIFQKGLDTLLEAFRRLACQRPQLELRIAGRGRDAGQLEELARELGIDDQVAFLGAVSDAERLELFAGARVLLMPSRFEGFGMVAAEAMAAGVPLVASRAGALPEVVRPPDGGVLVPPDDPAALARATAELLDDATRRAAMSDSARRAARRFTWERVSRAHRAFLEDIAAEGGSAHEPVSSS